MRKAWTQDAQLFVSYVHSWSRVESNDFGSMFTNLDTPLLEPNDTESPSIAEVPHRLRAWSTFTLPHRVVLSPAVDWRTGFPYSVQDMSRHYVGGFNTLRLPTWFAVDLTAFKTFDAFSPQDGPGPAGLQPDQPLQPARRHLGHRLAPLRGAHQQPGRHLRRLHADPVVVQSSEADFRLAAEIRTPEAKSRGAEGV